MKLFIRTILFTFIFIVISLSFALSVACSQEIAQAQTGESQSEPSPEELMKLVDMLMDKVSATRGLKFKEPVNKVVSTQDDIRKMLLEDLEDPEVLKQIDGEGKMLSKLGLFPENFDYQKFMIDLYLDQLGGCYVPSTKTIHIAAWMPPESQESIFAHELTHALQDQYFDLASLREGEECNSDTSIAITSIIEGEATFIMLEFMLKDMGMSISDLPNLSMVQFMEFMPSSDSEILKAAPAILVETLNFPYLYGTDFFMAFLRERGWKRVSDLYSTLPKSTEQIIHPEKYLSQNKDNPVKIDLKSPESVLGKGWTNINTDVLGEFFFKILFREFTTRGTATIASQGWGGDQIQVLEKGATVIIVMMTAWDSAKDGQEFFKAYKEVIEKKYSSERVVDSSDTHSLWSTEDKYVYMGINQDKVFIVEGASEDSIYKLIKAYWN